MEEISKPKREPPTNNYWSHSPYAAYGCFPARNVVRWNPDGGAWLTAYKEQQAKRFKAVLCSSNSHEKEKLTQAYSKDTGIKNDLTAKRKESFASERVVMRRLSASILLKECHVKMKSDLASINISGKKLDDPPSDEDFSAFANVYRVNASDNELSLEVFDNFPSLEELELQANKISHVRLTPTMFRTLKILNLSHNNFQSEDLTSIGLIPNLQKLLLSGNDLESLPANFSGSYVVRDGLESIDQQCIVRFSQLTELHLDNNKLSDVSTFSILAGLKRLRILNLSSNELNYIPQLCVTLKSDVDVIDTRQGGNKEVDSISLDYEPNEMPAEEVQQTLPEPDEVLEKSSVVKQDEASVDTKAELAAEISDKNVLHGETIGFEEEVKLLDGTLQDLNVEGLDTDILNLEERLDIGTEKTTTKPEEVDLAIDLQTDRKNTLTDRSSFGMLFTPSSAPVHPFSKLEQLDISCNNFKDEQAILSVAAWRSLRKLIIWGNPLTENKKGDPPILRRHLSQLCGISIVRKKPNSKGEKIAFGPIIAPAAKVNKVRDVLPPIRKPNQLMIEFQKKELEWMEEMGKTLPSLHEREFPKRESRTPPESSVPNKEDLNPLQNGRSQSAKELATPNEASMTHQTQNPDAGTENRDKEGVFLTQVDDQDILYSNDVNEATSKANEMLKDVPNSSEQERNVLTGGYDELLAITDEYEDEVPLPSTLRGSLIALRHALDNPLVFNTRDPDTRLPRTDIGKKSTAKTTSTSSPNTRMKAYELMSALDRMRTDSHNTEENLGTILGKYNEDPKIRKQFPEVKKLMKEVQSKYNEVRMASLKSATEAQTIAQKLKTTGRESKQLPGSNSPKKWKSSQNSERGASRDSKGRGSPSTVANADDNHDIGNKLASFRSLVEKRI